MPTSPTELRLAITQVPPRLSTRSWRRRISSISPVRLNANMTLRPLRSACRLMTAITARTRASNGQCATVRLQFVVLDEIDAALRTRSRPRPAVSFGREADGRFDDGADQRPAAHTGQLARALDGEFRSRDRRRAKASGSRRSRMRRPENCFSSNRLPATVAMRLGNDGPMLSSGHDSVTRAVTRRPPSTGSAATRQAWLVHLAQHLQTLDASGRARLEFRGFRRAPGQRCPTIVRRP